MNLEPIKQFHYEKDRMYAITINPSDKYQYNGRTNRQILFRNYVNEHICGNLNADYCFVIEYSEPFGEITSVPRLHLHGTITFRTISQIGEFLNTGLYKLKRHSIIKIGHINNELTWIDYMFKQQILTDNYKVISNDPELLQRQPLLTT